MRYHMVCEKSWNLPGYHYTLIDTKKPEGHAKRELLTLYTNSPAAPAVMVGRMAYLNREDA